MTPIVKFMRGSLSSILVNRLVLNLKRAAAPQDITTPSLSGSRLSVNSIIGNIGASLDYGTGDSYGDEESGEHEENGENGEYESEDLEHLRPLGLKQI